MVICHVRDFEIDVDFRVERLVFMAAVTIAGCPGGNGNALARRTGNGIIRKLKLLRQNVACKSIIFNAGCIDVNETTGLYIAFKRDRREVFSAGDIPFFNDALHFY